MTSTASWNLSNLILSSIKDRRALRSSGYWFGSSRVSTVAAVVAGVGVTVLWLSPSKYDEVAAMAKNECRFHDGDYNFVGGGFKGLGGSMVWA
ncbi:hypothetical protein SLA2020_459280 [Shorea laevis]